MAPPSGSSRPSKAGANAKQPVPRPVMPALPLPYVRRQAAAATAAAEKKQSPVIESKSDLNETNGVVPDSQDAKHTAAAATQKLETSLGEPDELRAATSIPNEGSGNAATAVQVSPRHRSSGSAATAAVSAAEPNVNNDAANGRINSERASLATVNDVGGPVYPDTMQPDNHLAKLTNSRPPPHTVSPPRYQMPPPFQPGSRPMGMPGNGDVPRPSRSHVPNGPRMHSAHPSNSSLHFGTFHDSQSSSPAPPHSGGIAPPPGMPLPDGRQPYMGHAGNGFPPMMPFGGDMMPASNFDNYGRHATAYAPMDSYPPYGNGLGPSTPHSFHDSQSSAHPEDNGAYNQFPPATIRNGSAGAGDDGKQQGAPGRMFGHPDYHRMMPSQLPPHMIPHGDDADGLVGYLQQQFASPELSDCTLELRYTDDRAAPVRILGHRLIFSRSAELAQRLRQQQSTPLDRSPQTLLIETDSKWVRSDAFYMAVQRLYGLPLLHVPPPRNSMNGGDMADAGSAADQFEFALSYAAAGHLLGWAPIAKRGCEVATQLLSWQTLEKALEYALHGYSDRGSHETYTYGEGSRMILNAAVVFIVHNVPSSFSLDVSSPESEQFARLPLHPTEPPTPTPAAAKVTSPTVSQGSVQFGKGRRSQNLPNIQFGDMSLSEGKGSSSAGETPRATKQAQPVSHDVLSRVLLSIPFTQLKMILESAGSGNVNGWANAEARYRIIKSAVEEREARRLRALDAVGKGNVPDAEPARAGLQSPTPQALGRWTALGWQEEMLPYGNPDGPSLGRKWAPLVQSHSGPGAEYP